jgi:hypothetical protein
MAFSSYLVQDGFQDQADDQSDTEMVVNPMIRGTMFKKTILLINSN